MTTSPRSEPSIVRASAMPPNTPHVAVAIVGAGACGLTAAVALADAGVECVVVERDAQPQGSTALSSGFIPAAGTLAQRAAGVSDSVDAFAADIPPRRTARRPSTWFAPTPRPSHPRSMPCSNATVCSGTCSMAFSTPATRRAACMRCPSAPVQR